MRPTCLLVVLLLSGCSDATPGGPLSDGGPRGERTDPCAGLDAKAGCRHQDQGNDFYAVPFDCGGVTCYPDQVCVSPCSGPDLGSEPQPICIDLPKACGAEATCTCLEGAGYPASRFQDYRGVEQCPPQCA